mgnify:FL=1
MVGLSIVGIYAVIYFIGKACAHYFNLAMRRIVIADTRYLGWFFVLIAAAIWAYIVTKSASSDLTNFSRGQAMGALVIGPLVMFFIAVAVVAWWRNRSRK